MDYEDDIPSDRKCTSCHDTLYIKVNESHQRIDFKCKNPLCDSQKTTTERVTAKMQFCPICRHMTRSVEGPGNKLQVKCSRPGCTYVGTAITMLVQSQNHRKVTEDAQINWRDMSLDKTLQRAYGSPCMNPSCVNSELLLFQIQSPNGVESYAICTLCKYHWALH